jgi:hypothetical protein
VFLQLLVHIIIFREPGQVSALKSATNHTRKRFTVVRMGHLAWDSYETSDGKFDFAWFDNVMDLMDPIEMIEIN